MSTLEQLRRARRPLWALAAAFAALGWFAAGVLWAGAVVCLVLAVWNEALIRRGRRLGAEGRHYARRP